MLINCFLTNGSEGKRTSQEGQRTWPPDGNVWRAAGPQQFVHTARILSPHSPSLHREVSHYCGFPGNNKTRINIYLYIFWCTQHTLKTANGYTSKETSRLTSWMQCMEMRQGCISWCLIKQQPLQGDYLAMTAPPAPPPPPAHRGALGKLNFSILLFPHM